MLLHINTLSGSLPPVQVPANATTNDLKRRIYDLCPEQSNKKIRVMKAKGANNKFVELKKMHKSISLYGVEDGSELSMVFDDFHELNVADIDELIVQCLKQIDTDANSSLHEIIVNALCECSGALNLCNLARSIVTCCPRFGADRFCAAFVDALSYTIHSISILDFSHNALKTPTIRLIKQCISSNPCVTELNLSSSNLQRADANVIANIVAASNSSIRKLDVSGNCFLSSGIAAIATAMCKNQSITDFDVSNTDQSFQDMESSKAGTLPSALCSMIKSNSSIQKLNLSHMSLSNDCIKFLADGFLFNQTITDLDLSGNVFQEDEIASLSRLVESNAAIIKLKLSNIFGEFFNLAVESAISNAFGFNSTITDLEIDWRGFSAEGKHLFANMIAANKTILKLKIFDICVEPCNVLFDALAQNHSVTDFTTRIYRTNEDESTLKLSKALTNMIRCNSRIVKLDLSHSRFSYESAAISIADALSHNTCIQELNLNQCGINSNGGIALASMLDSNKTITKLCLNTNNFNAAAIMAIANSSIQHQTIQSLDLELTSKRMFWSPNEPSIHAFCDMIVMSASLKTLNISNLGFSVDSELVVKFFEALKNNRSITDINLQNCFCFNPEPNVTSIADLISSNSSIVKLNLAQNGLVEDALVMIAKSLKINQSITDFDISGNGMGDNSAVGFLKAIEHNKNIKSIKLFEPEALRRSFDDQTSWNSLAESTVELLHAALFSGKYPQISRPSRSYLFFF